MVVLAYKCLSSTRSYEPGPIYSSGLSFAQAVSLANSGKDFCVSPQRRPHRVEGLPWALSDAGGNPGYRWYWVDSVVREMRDSPFDGVMGDNDVENDYYGLNLAHSGRAVYDHDS